MRIYLDKLWLNIDLQNINSILSSSEDLIYLYSTDGIFIIQNNKIMKIDINDGEINTIDDYIDGYNITIDTTIIKKSRDYVSCLPCNHIKIDKKVSYYNLRDKSQLTFVVECIDNEVSDFYFILEGYHAKYSNADLNNPSIREDFSDFLNIIYKK
jgi:hypothetical protein|tara:strand:- start:1914 stop:2378 length:465 start_codon:yes stop_codon:yes gene_type:complete